MATDINDGMTKERPIMTVSRRLAGPPWRSAERTWADLRQFCLTVLEQRSFPRRAETAAALQALLPLGRQWVIQHLLEGEGLVFDMGDLQIHVRITYQAEPDEDLSPPPLELLDALPADTPLTIRVHGPSRAQEPAIAQLIDAAAESGLTVEFVPDPGEEQIDGHDAQ